ncbi:unnamed protein product [Adineta steineri]|uniref:LamG-like jellyroll fold domain-containing protein n=1 Tax=Adineta steineri TaxID=433720 RepID=A0A813P951_9BILA|nr:unnamed protein product [Adineta steineri]
MYINLDRSTTVSTDESVNTTTNFSSTTIPSEYDIPYANYTCAGKTANPRSNLSTFWSFDSNTYDSLNQANATAINNPMYFAAYAGPGNCIMFDGISQYAIAPLIDFTNQSFTIELVIFLNTFLKTAMISILSQCASMNETNQCFNLGILNSKLFFGFNNDNLYGTTSLAVNQWYHLAFVFDIENLNQRVYLNGVLDGSRTATNPYLGTFGNTIIGYQTNGPKSSLFPGYMDNLLIYRGRVKTDCEIHTDTFLYAYYSWDNGLPIDDGPNSIDGTFVKSVSSVSGYSNNGLSFSSTGSYFVVADFTALGLSYDPFTLSIWVKPSSFGGSIVHIAFNADGTTNCHTILGMSSSGQPVAQNYDITKIGLYSISDSNPLPLNQWTHLVETFSINNGFRLYVNGTLKAYKLGVGPFDGGNVPRRLFVGYYGTSGSSCTAGAVKSGQYKGIVDELRFYNVELMQDDISKLASM